MLPLPTIAGPRARPRGRSSAAALVALAVVGLIAASLATTVAAAPKLPSCIVADTLTAERSLDDWPRSILDSRFRLASTYAPKGLQTTSKAGLNGGPLVRRELMPDLSAMARAARTAGARLAVKSAYRSFASQKSTFAYWVRVHGLAYALKESARAGHSEHQLGTSLDFKSYGGPDPWNVKDWATSKAGKWMAANAWKYGFIMSYPKGKTAVTCYMYEPWHYRYVGRDVAAKVRASKLTLREYLWRQQEWPAPTPTPTPTPAPTPTPTPTPPAEG
jgi:D-alanyl-D-alanine carboxypeptidase